MRRSIPWKVKLGLSPIIRDSRDQELCLADTGSYSAVLFKAIGSGHPGTPLTPKCVLHLKLRKCDLFRQDPGELCAVS